MRLPTTADLDAPPTGDGNNTAAYVCRDHPRQHPLSAHAYGLAIDVNPFLNPYRKGDLVLPELASAYLDRSWHRPGMVLRGGVVTRAFAAVGWTWGGDFSSRLGPDALLRERPLNRALRAGLSAPGRRVGRT